MSNKDFWDRAKTTDPSRVKPITGKPYKGNSPQPYYIVERLTDAFGMCGVGWGLRVINERMEKLSEHDILHIARIELWYVQGEQRGSIEQIGQTKAAYMTSKGIVMVDEDAPKKSVTDAMVKCASYLGFAGDIFSGLWDDSKYVAQITKEFSAPPFDIADAIDAITAASTEAALRAAFAGYYKAAPGDKKEDVKAAYDARKFELSTESQKETA